MSTKQKKATHPEIHASVLISVEQLLEPFKQEAEKIGCDCDRDDDCLTISGPLRSLSKLMERLS